MKTQTNPRTPKWIQSADQMPEVGKKILVVIWRDKTVCQAWWNGEYFVLVAADQQGIIQVYQVLPEAISHWCDMPALPSASNNVHELIEQKYGTMH